MRKPATERSKVGLVFLVLLFLFWTREGNGQATGDATQLVETQPVVSQLQPAGESNSGPKQFFHTLWSDQKLLWTSPFRMNGGDAVTIALPLVAGTAGLMATDQDAANLLPNTPDQVKWSKRVSQIGALYTLGGVVGGLMLVGKKKDEPEIFNTGRSSARALVNAAIVNYGIKFAAARERPLENDGKGRFWKGGSSFPSGHSMHTWAVAVVIARSKSPKWLKITACTVATVVSLSRWGAQKHFPSDIVAGSVLGGLIGNYVATRANEPRMERP
jgi:membrane-associated phospholipid phosphatase